MWRLYACVRMRGSRETGVAQLPRQFCSSLIGDHAPILCLQLASTPRFFTVCDQTPSSTSFVSFISDAAVFLRSLTSERLWLPPIRPSARGPPRTLAGCLTAGDTVLLPTPRDCGGAPARPRESSRDRVTAAPQGFWTITTHIWWRLQPQRPCSSTSECGCSPRSTGAFVCCGGAHSLYQVSSQQANRLSPCGPKTPDFTLLLGIRPSHQSTAR